MNAITNLSPQQLRQAADIQERIVELQHELSQLLGSAPENGFEVPAGRKKLSAQGLANIRAGARRRWARFHGSNGGAKATRKGRGRMSAAGRASIAARMRARWAAAKRSGRNAL